MSASPLLFEGVRLTLAREGSSAIVSLFNPPHGYFDAQSERELLQALDLIDGEDGLRTVILTGREPGVFVRHYDVGVLERIGRTMQERGLAFSPEAPPPESGFHRCAARLEAGSWITIAAIGGWCMGGGMELALACKLRYAQAGDYLLGLPEVQLGIIPGGGGTQKLGRAVGHTRALEMLLLGTCVGPNEAARIGLVHAVVPDALAHARAVARTLDGRSPEALRHIVSLHAMAGQADAAAGMAAERGAFSQLVVRPFALEAMADFNGGRRSFPEADQ
ncbi:enoyl-CoA hydratase/isomerase family protein [Massilia cavernae]|uniref:Enoyl-CoA hydratase/isomerase family protein n=1 Tax=Massilia cavernae TaxID=2320864 RepID=A0A418Y0P6_9BURK|nr:enoyl-CoA hydratase/isomerase family protein [Massilia cavernae]RJG18842.1 enoyl-CoA hydratase/isomerase family protein [Massilia cavernae]